MVPNGWNKTYLKNIISGSIKNGYSPLPASNTTGYWVMSLGALTDSGINAKEIKPVDLDDKVKQALLTNGDFLVSRSNTPDKVGRSIRFKGEIQNCSYPDLMMKFRVDPEKADPNFVEFKLSSSEIRQYYKSCAAGSSSTMVKINKSTVENTPLLLPSLSEQKKIAQILSSWDKAITTTEQLLANSQQQKKALMQQLLTGKKRLLDKNGVLFSGEWKWLKVSDLLKVRKEKQVPSDDVPLYSLTIEDGITPKSERYNREFLVKNTDEKKYKLVNPKDIVYNPANLRWGAINFSRISHSVVVSPIYEVLYLKDDRKTSLEFVAQKLMTPDQIARFAAMVEGTLVERMAVKIEPFLATRLNIPPTFEEQQKIAAVLSSADQGIAALRQKLDALNQEKKALMQQLLTGKRRVKINEKEVA